jgi:hypothetical protein
MKFYDAWGTEFAYNHMSAGWSWAFDTPFDWFKQNASRLGGINQNMVISWPARIKDKGALREQFMHVIDVVPTHPRGHRHLRPRNRGRHQAEAPIEGTSFAYTFDAENAKAPSRHKTQYFEMMGQWALYHDGWLLSTKVNRAPWEAFSSRQSRPAQQPGVPALRPEHQLQPVRRHRRAASGQGQGDARCSSRRPRSTRSSRWTPRWGPGSRLRARASPPAATSCLHPPDDRLAAGRCPLSAQHLLHHHGGHHRARRRCRGHDRDLRRALRRVRLLPARGQAGVPVEPARPGADQVGRPGMRSRPASTPSSSSFKYDGLGAGTMAYNNFSGIGRSAPAR